MYVTPAMAHKQLIQTCAAAGLQRQRTWLGCVVKAAAYVLSTQFKLQILEMPQMAGIPCADKTKDLGNELQLNHSGKWLPVN